MIRFELRQTPRKDNDMTKRREITINTPSGAKFIVRKSHNGKDVNAVRFEKDQRITEIMNDGKQWHEVNGTVILSYPATGKYAWTLKDMVEHVEEEIAFGSHSYR